MIANFMVSQVRLLERSLTTKKGGCERPTAVYFFVPNYNRRIKDDS